MKSFLKICCLLLAFALINSCDRNRVYEEVYDFEEGIWNMDTIPAFNFEISDNAPKRVLINVRNSIEFRSQNLYLTYYLMDEKGNELKSELVNVQLFDAKTGKPFGKGNSIFQHEVEILPNYSFPSIGKYQIKIAQYMREANLENVPSVGVRLENVDR
ncbi:MAG: gliding motility lipoprotein GldH [Cytophagales bacterium CG12_big_fil_rev_8_21_14_0_65_40_12]|nr:MAG: gliding motility lipoprotein GldH [Cytophagales bacterium CG12_big_fil_rev_8_21_14_0_65_40_12]PIW05254.1 MAG: gliding motility lipoprotein GldH [Cytophagales bacterium CG17_big_fil_post_rev_8_21_14_2_50_40_13]